MMSRVLRQTLRFFSSTTSDKIPGAKTLSNGAYKIRSLRFDDIPEVVQISRESMFQYPVSSLQFWARHDPDGIKVAVSEESGKILGVCGTVKNNENLFFGGMFSVQEKSRAADVGRKLLSACHAHADGRNIAVNCEMNKIGTFKRRGVAIFEDTFKSLEYEIYSRANSAVLSEELPSGVEILPFQSQYLEAVYEYDHSLMGYERKSTVEASCYEDNSKTLMAIKDGKCVGFGSIKLNIMGIARVGPLYANDPDVAEAMLKKLINEMPEVSGFTTVTVSSNLFANMMMEKLGLPVHGNIYRLYSKEKLKIDTNKVFSHFDIDFAPF